MAKHKGIHKLLEACAGLVRRGCTQFSVVLAGPTDESGRLIRLSGDLGLQDHVRWAGPVPYRDLAGYYRACDAFVFPTLEDVLGMVVPEAMIFSKPVLCSKYAGAAEWVRDGENGYIIDPWNPEQTAERMARLIDSPGLREAFGRKSAELIAPHTTQRCAATLENAVYNVLNGGRRPPASQLDSLGAQDAA